MFRLIKWSKWIAPLLAILLCVPAEVLAKGRSLIRDTEAETIIRDFAAPLLKAANIEPSSVNFILIQDDDLNAFVAGGRNIFLYTGLLMRAETPDQLTGVLAHEIGHISGGHLARASNAAKTSSRASLLSILLGAATIVATGRGDAAAAIVSGGQELAKREFLRFSRSQESAADQAAVRLLDATQHSSRGLLEFLEILSAEELLVRARRSAYSGTHPLTQDRLSFAREHLASSPHSDTAPSLRDQERFQRLRAKLYAFIKPPNSTLRRFADDQSLVGRYARVIATYRQPDLIRAIAMLDAMIAEYPDDPYLVELKGQILFEAGKPGQARAAYLLAHAMLPKAPLIAVELARAELALNTPEMNNLALGRLKSAVRLEPETPSVWHQLAIAEGRTGNKGMAALALAEEAILSRRLRDASIQAKRAQSMLDRGTPGWLRALDLETLAQRDLKSRKR
jgi:predicted Zn-dependent protease